MAAFRIKENGDDRSSTIEIPMKPSGVKITMGIGTFLAVASILSGWVFGFSKGRLPASLGTSSSVERRVSENSGTIQAVKESLDEFRVSMEEASNRDIENRRFMVAMYRQIKLLCEAQGVQILLEPEDFFER